jgi:hypothetical protein
MHEMSTPWSNARKPSGVAHVLSRMLTTPRARAAAAIARMSCTSKVSEPGDSMNTMRVSSRSSASMAPPIDGS